MSNSYDDAKYGVVQRHWIGLTRKYGGNSNKGFKCTPVPGGWGTTDATSATILTSWYPKGPIKLLKVGCLTLTAITNASTDLLPAYVKTRGASASVVGTLYFKDTSTADTAGDINSIVDFTVSQCKQGEYIYIKTGTPRTDKGTAANTATVTGTLAIFFDYVPLFSSKWDT